MRIPIHQVDAFTGEVFHGNPAAVCPLQAWLPGPTMQAIAAENNLSETAFFVGADGAYDIRWFTPVTEVDLCGHATLASAHVLFEASDRRELTFGSKSGVLRVTKVEDRISLDFPARLASSVPAPPGLEQALGRRPTEVLVAADNLLAVFREEQDVRALRPDMVGLMALDASGVIVTAPGSDCDFVSRFFAPKEGIPEDPVTGSAHCTLAPYWATRLGKVALHARQVSARGGVLQCEDRGGRVLIAGQARKYLEGFIEVP